MKDLKHRSALLGRMIRLHEHELDLARAECRQARQVLERAESDANRVHEEVERIETGIRAVLEGRAALHFDELQAQRRYLDYLRGEWAKAEERRKHVAELDERLSQALVHKQAKLNKLQEMSSQTNRERSLAEEKQLYRELDELWVQSRGH